MGYSRPNHGVIGMTHWILLTIFFFGEITPHFFMFIKQHFTLKNKYYSHIRRESKRSVFKINLFIFGNSSERENTIFTVLEWDKKRLLFFYDKYQNNQIISFPLYRH